MNKYISVLMLRIRSTFYKILLLFACLFGIEIFLLNRRWNILTAGNAVDPVFSMSLNALIDESKIHLVFLAAFLFITVILTLNGFEFKEKINYTIRRLTITEKQYYFIHGFYNSMAYLLLFLVQLMIITAFSLYYAKMAPDTFYSNQTLFLTFYSNDFLHSLLPLEETVRVVRNIILIFTFGYTTAYQSYTQRRGKKQWMLLPFSFLTILNFKSALGTFIGDAFLICVCVIIWLIIGYNLRKGGDGYED